MIPRLPLLAFLLSIAAPAAAQVCPADLDRSGEATVDELTVAIDGSLGQCRADPGCPFGFLDDTLETGDCVFVGSIQDAAESPTCVVDDVAISWYSDGSVAVLFFPTFDEPLFIGVDALDPEVGDVFGWTDDIDQSTTALGGLVLMDEQHSALGLFIENTPFTVDGCPFTFLFTSYDSFVVVEGSAAARRARPALRRASKASTARELSEGLRTRSGNHR